METRIPEDTWRKEPETPTFPRRYVSAALGVFGGVLGAVVVGYGYVLLVALLDFGFTPPLRSAGSYGQFGMIVFVSVPLGVAAGCSFAMIPYTRFFPWLLCFLLIIVSTGQGVAYGDPRDPVHAAAILMHLWIVITAIVTSRMVRSAELKYTRQSDDAKSVEGVR